MPYLKTKKKTKETAAVALWGHHANQFDAEGIQAASINGPVAVLFIGLTVGLYDGVLYCLYTYFSTSFGTA